MFQCILGEAKLRIFTSLHFHASLTRRTRHRGEANTHEAAPLPLNDVVRHNSSSVGRKGTLHIHKQSLLVRGTVIVP